MRVFKKREKWWVDFRDPDGKRRRRCVGHSKREAERVLKSVRESILKGTFFQDQEQEEDRRDYDLTLRELWRAFEGRPGISPNTRKTEKVIAERILLPFFGEKTRLQALTPTALSHFVRWRLEEGLTQKRGVQKTTVSRDLSVLRSMLKWGREFLPGQVPPIQIPKNRSLKLPNKSPERIDFLSREELNKLIDEARATSKTRLLPAIALGAFAGLRRSEIVSLRWEDVKIETSVIRIRNYSKKGQARVRTKNEENRLVPIRPELAAILKEVQSEHLAEGGLPELVVPANREGKPAKTFIGAWRRLLERCGVRALPLHALRHTCASHMVMSGVPLLSVASFLGHKSTEMTERYAHLAPDHLSTEMYRVARWHQEGTTPIPGSNEKEQPLS